MSYTTEREQFIVRATQEGLPYWAAVKLLRIATTIHRLAELACSSEAADRDRIRCPAQHVDARSIRRVVRGVPCLCDRPNGQHEDIPRIRLQDWRAEQRAIQVLAEVNVKTGLYKGNETQGALWSLVTDGDPRGYTLRIIPPSYAERNQGRDRHNLDSIGVPARESGLRF